MPFRHLLEARSIDIVMIDLLRVGGITQWMKVAGMAEAFNLPVVSHLIPEIHVHLVAAIPNGLTVEYMPWTLSLYEETPDDRGRPARGAEEAGPRPRLRPGRDQALPGRLAAERLQHEAVVVDALGLELHARRHDVEGAHGLDHPRDAVAADE